ncbi:MAG: PAS domain S-box protein [Devosia sp.]|nr:PAS domain S-box protein [Devosia sp.]
MPQSAERQASHLESILDSAVDAIIAINAQGIIETVNPATERLFGYSRDEFIGRNVHFLMPEPYHSEHDSYIGNYLSSGRRKIIGIGRQVIGRRRDGTTFPMHLSVSEFSVGGQRHFTGIIHDMTEQTNAEQALRQSQKMEALGQLTGGIAHDFNNLLTVIVGNLEMLEAKLSDSAQLSLVNEALEAADLGARLTGRLLTFARRSMLEPKLVDLNTFVSGLTDMLQRTLGETVALTTSLSPELWVTRVDPSQVESAIINLAVNSRDAMPNGGRLLIETSNTHIDEAYAAAEPGLSPGDYIRLSVSDDGVGMPAAIRERAFEPFFTTKEQGKGTGLGLSMIYGFARQSGGHATIYSEQGMGTTVRIYLPRHYLPAASDVLGAVADRMTLGVGQTVLVVEDDPRVRRLTVTRLGELGYQVVEATNGAEALAVLSNSTGVELVFTDLVMPDMSGYELAARVRELYPQIRLLLTSGYAEEFANSDRLFSEQLRLLRKPYRLADLAAAVHRAIAAEI